MHNNIELKAHRLILAISCEFFKDLFEACFLESEDLIKISLPHYSADSMTLLLKFFYTGETYIPPVILQEFLDCCLEFNAGEFAIPKYSSKTILIIHYFRQHNRRRYPSKTIQN